MASDKILKVLFKPLGEDAALLFQLLHQRSGDEGGVLGVLFVKFDIGLRVFSGRLFSGGHLGGKGAFAIVEVTCRP